MSLPAAAVPLAVLVLAWDETAPAVRALVEAAETPATPLDSVVVLVPAATGEPVQEEFLPLVAEPTPLETTAEAALPAAEAAEVAPVAPAEPRLPSSPATDLLPEAIDFVAPGMPLPVASIEASPPPVLLPALLAPLAWSEVRVLRLSSFDLPTLAELSNRALPRPIWQSTVGLPAAPYLGSQPAAIGNPAHSATNQVETQPTAAVVHFSSPAGASVPPSPTPSGQSKSAQAMPGPAAPAPDYSLAALPLPALDAEADLATILPDELAAAETVPTEAPRPEAQGQVQAGWAEALASLRTPLPTDEQFPTPSLAEEATDAGATLDAAPAATSAISAAFQLVSQPFEVPDLNFQVIQYARFAVPVALAQAPFAAIYAAAWPTWLAAQELRHRTRQPLVLHVATLAAGEDQSLASATGWQAELQRQALQRADLILAETPELARRLRHDLGLAPELVRAVSAADATAVAQALHTVQLRTSRDAA